MRRATGLAVLGVAFLVGLGSQAAPLEPTPVFLVGDDPAKQTVYAPPELLKQLRDLADRPAGPRNPVLLGAHYEGTAEGDSVRFNAAFEVQTFNAKFPTLEWPLTGVRMEEVLCDGAIVYPTVLPAKTELGGELAASPGFAVKVEGVGKHMLRTRFRVPIVGSEDREIQFGAPRLVQNRLTLTVPPGPPTCMLRCARGRRKSIRTAGGWRWILAG